MTRQQEYFYHKLDEYFPGMKTTIYPDIINNNAEVKHGRLMEIFQTIAVDTDTIPSG